MGSQSILSSVDDGARRRSVLNRSSTSAANLTASLASSSSSSSGSRSVFGVDFVGSGMLPSLPSSLFCKISLYCCFLFGYLGSRPPCAAKT
eukprot:8659294-Pyramimonas_sp.AAC.1